MRDIRRPAFVAVALAVLGGSCVTAPTLPLRSPGLEEMRDSAAGALARAYPDWATGIGPVPGRVVGLLMPADSRWGRSLQSIGPSLVRNLGAYAGLGPEWVRTYELYAREVSPRRVWFAAPGEPGGVLRSEKAIRTLDDEVRSFDATLLIPGMPNPWALEAEGHIAALEISGGEGNAPGPRFEVVVTRVEVLDGRPGYPASVVELLDGARAEFDRFLELEAPRVATLLATEAAAAAGEAEADPPGTRPRVADAEAIFPYWDDERRRLVVLFYRSVLRITEYSIPCRFVYEGMPAEQRSMTIRHGYGVELGQKLELDADGVLVALTSFDPAVFRIPSNAPDGASSSKQFSVVCPGSPGARGNPGWRAEDHG